jgi:trimeric autotransporter adhesin
MRKVEISIFPLGLLSCALMSTCPSIAQQSGDTLSASGVAPAASQQAAAIAITPFLVRGNIKSGATPLPGVTVTASDALTGKKVSAATGPDGAFQLALPTRGRYVIKAEQSAFAPITKEVVVTPESPQANVDADLMLASRAQILAAQQQQGAAQQIAAALANRGMQSLSVTESEAGGSPIGGGADNSSQIASGLPLNGAGADAPTESVSINGAMGQAQNFGMNPDELQDRVQEFRDRMQREGGNGGGGMVLMGPGEGGGFGGGPRGGPGVFVLGGRVGRLNVNQPHGSIFYSTDNSIFDAAPYSLTLPGSTSASSLQKSDYDQNRFGVTLGSPLHIPHVIKDDKTFIVLNWTGGRNSNPYDQYSTVPTLAERQGDFSALPTQLLDPSTHQPIPGNTITSINSAAQKLLQFIPLPNLPGSARNFHFVTSLTQNNDQVAVRLIHNFGEGATFMPMGGRGGGGGGRGGRGRARNNINFNLNYSDSHGQVSNPFPTLLGTTDTSGINTGAGWVVSKNRLTNNLHFNYNRSHTRLSNLYQDNQNIAAEAGISGVSQNPFDYGVPALSFNQFQTVRDTGATLGNNQTFAWSDSVIWRRGKHNVRLGGDFRRIYNDIHTDQNGRGSFTFNGSATGNDFADFLFGLPALTSIQSGNTTYQFRQNSWDLFVQDDWRATGNLSFNFGLRYEYVSPFSEAQNRLVNLDINPTISAVSPVLPGAVGPFTGGFPITVIEPDRNNFAPRVGMAWKAGKKTVVRGGYGINYNTGQYGSIVQNLAYQPPFAFTETNVASQTQTLTLQNGFPGTSAAVTNNFAVDKNYKLGYVQIWNLDIQRELSPSLLINIGYNGSKGTDLDMERAPNRLPNGQLRIADVQPFILETSQGDSILHAGSLRVRKRLRHGISAQGTYVFSKSIDNASSIGGGAEVVAQNDQDLAAERGLSSFDQRHRFTGNFVYELPFGTGKKWLNNSGGWLENALGDWQWSGDFTIASGLPFTPRVLGAFTDISQGVNGTLRADLTGAPITLSDPNVNEWFNPAAFTAPPVGQFGDARRNSIIGPGQLSFDMSVSKTLLAKDTRALELRIGANNVFNRPQFTTIDTVLNSPTFGYVIGAGAMRRVTMSARYRF